MPPTQAPAQPDPTFDPFRAALQAYIDQTQPYRKVAAETQASTPGKTDGTSNAAVAVRARQNSLADALRTTIRPDAQPGAIFAPATASALKHQLDVVLKSPRRSLILDELAEQAEGGDRKPGPPRINQTLKAPRVPPRLVDALPPLPKQLEYDFAGRTLILRDVDADVVVDYLADVLPAPNAPAPAAAAPVKIEPGTTSPLPMPDTRGATTFALMGDMGSGDVAQEQVAQAMLTYFDTARHFPFVLMLGDNLYHDDYEGEFLEPYKPLLDRGVKFYAALGNHDRDLEQHFKPFNMGDKDHYSFDESNIRFVALNSNRPNDAEQLKWLDTVFADAGDKWRIAFFHHPLYSSGQHSAEGRDVIRPAFEEALIRNRVLVTFTGHEHLYERIKPQKGIHHFVSGGGGRYLYSFHPSDFDAVGVSEHHFMVAQINGDTMLFEAISHAQKVIDCGVVYRTQNAAEKPDDHTKTWLTECDAAKPRAITTQNGRR
jgi:3',5'-cyclic AMP phosphodiesterase CpdA